MNKVIYQKNQPSRTRTKYTTAADPSLGGRGEGGWGTGWGWGRGGGIERGALGLEPSGSNLRDRTLGIELIVSGRVWFGDAVRRRQPRALRSVVQIC